MNEKEIQDFTIQRKMKSSGLIRFCFLLLIMISIFEEVDGKKRKKCSDEPNHLCVLHWYDKSPAYIDRALTNNPEIKGLVFRLPDSYTVARNIKKKFLCCEFDNYRSEYIYNFKWFLTIVGQDLMEKFYNESRCARNLQAEDAIKQKVKVVLIRKALLAYVKFCDEMVGASYTDGVKLLDKRETPIAMIDSYNSQVKDKMFAKIAKNREQFFKAYVKSTRSMVEFLHKNEIEEVHSERDFCKKLIRHPKKDESEYESYVYYFTSILVVIVAIVFYFKSIYADCMVGGRHSSRYSQVSVHSKQGSFRRAFGTRTSASATSTVGHIDLLDDD